MSARFETSRAGIRVLPFFGYSVVVLVVLVVVVKDVSPLLLELLDDLDLLRRELL